MSDNVAALPTALEHPGKWRAALARVQGKSQEAAAKAGGVATKTVQRWQYSDPVYARYYSEHQDTLRGATWGLVWAVLLGHVASSDPSVSLMACRIMLASMDRDRPQSMSVVNEDRVVIVVEEEVPLPETDPNA